MIKNLFLKIIKSYQRFISPVLGNNCRFYPSCSQYSYLVIEKYGLFKGLILSFKRLSKCHPWSEGGIDSP